MSIGMRLDLRQTQQLVMTPQLQQAIKLLTMSNLELQHFVAQEVEQNPLLQVASPDGVTDEIEAPTPAPEMVVATDQRTEDHALSGEVFDTGTENLHDTSPSDGPSPLAEPWEGPDRRSAAMSFEGLSALEERLAEPSGLRDHLRQQIGRMSTTCPTTVLFARYLVEELDEHGYFRGDLDELSERLNVGREIAEAGLAILQGCEPTGVGARSLAECLSLQLRDRGTIEPPMQALLDNLALLGRADMKKLRRLCGVDADQFSDLVTQLRRLNPRPCASFDEVEPPSLVPDIIIAPTSWGGWNIELNAETLPKVLIDRTYRAMVGKVRCTETREFLSTCHTNANWLVKSLDQRANTILKVASEIVRQQQRFFNDGIQGLKPLTLKGIADAVDLHESTVSRVTTNKFIATDFGIFELKFFFTNAIGGDDSDVAAETVRRRIKTLVDDEAGSTVLSDDAIVTKLKAEGVDVARRTVAKYRKSLNIPSSVERRRQQVLTAGIFGASR